MFDLHCKWCKMDFDICEQNEVMCDNCHKTFCMNDTLNIKEFFFDNEEEYYPDIIPLCLDCAHEHEIYEGWCGEDGGVYRR